MALPEPGVAGSSFQDTWQFMGRLAELGKRHLCTGLTKRNSHEGTAGRVEFVMPAYNAGLYIEESIGSVIAQTYPYWELIVVDDGSTDDSRRKVETLLLPMQGCGIYTRRMAGKARQETPALQWPGRAGCFS